MVVLGNYDAPTGVWTPTPAFVSELQNDPAGLGYKNADGTFKSAAAIGKLLTDPFGTVANPTPQPTIAKPFTYTDVLGLLSAASQVNVRALPELSRVLDDMNAQNRHAVTVWAGLLLAGSSPVITQAEHDAIVALMNATELDPSWPSTVPAASRLEQAFGVGAVASALITAVTKVS